MTCVRKKTINGKDYYYEQQSYRDSNGNVKTKHIKYLGTTQLKKGTNLEYKEHSTTLTKLKKGKITEKQASEEIAQSHLKEDPNYYNKMENKEDKKNMEYVKKNYNSDYKFESKKD